MSAPKKPTKIRVGAEMYRVVVLLVTSRDQYDDETITLKGGEEFITAFVPERVVAPRAN